MKERKKGEKEEGKGRNQNKKGDEGRKKTRREWVKRKGNGWGGREEVFLVYGSNVALGMGPGFQLLLPFKKPFLFGLTPNCA